MKHNLPRIITYLGIGLVLFTIVGMWLNAAHQFGPRCVAAFSGTIGIGALVMLIIFLVWLIGETLDSED